MVFGYRVCMEVVEVSWSNKGGVSYLIYVYLKRDIRDISFFLLWKDKVISFVIIS